MASAFESNIAQLCVGERKYIMRTLKMTGSTMVIITSPAAEVINELGIALCMPQTNEVVCTSAIGGMTESQLLAKKLSTRFKRQFFVSINVNMDRMSRPLLEKQIAEYINSHKNEFA